ncbi:MAG: hypothetical protein EXS00_08395 [Phycisphaerales bacterium]|nr:hypothetical protein [Phycisphaerales bacterium]
MSRQVETPGVITAFRWTARLTSILSLGAMSAAVMGDGPGALKLSGSEILLFAFFPLGVGAGMLLGWWRERLGGLLGVGSLGGFYILHGLLGDGFPLGSAFVTLSTPALLFLAAGTLALKHQLSLRKSPC